VRESICFEPSDGRPQLVESSRQNPGSRQQAGKRRIQAQSLPWRFAIEERQNEDKE
jgi:hypothetical protein